MKYDVKIPDELEEGTLSFFASAPDALPVYLALREKLLAFGPDVQARVQKTQITFRARRVFACASLAPRAAGAPLLVTFGLPFRVDSSRVWQAVEPYPNRWTHHVPVAREEELDDELMGWLRMACDFSRSKR